jgi:hypothetical protein
LVPIEFEGAPALVDVMHNGLPPNRYQQQN